ncbi:DUF6400 family protein [Streptomyces sp. NBC_00829]|uniref:DUF6400 family protein n=1 Tax=Streptomyces sp. NBC_00829 TaxID=2903679 RepID=UPI0038706848|nr:DUF6400 family protein [Streptomyces sp. NBC_00829]
MIHDQTPDHYEFAIDLSSDEARRRATVLEAIGDDWDPVAVLEGEQEAYRLLYSNLDARQQETYDRLVAAGVLPGREGEGHASA